MKTLIKTRVLFDSIERLFRIRNRPMAAMPKMKMAGTNLNQRFPHTNEYKANPLK